MRAYYTMPMGTRYHVSINILITLANPKKASKGLRSHVSCRYIQMHKPQYVEMQVVAELKGKIIASLLRAVLQMEQTNAYRSYRKPLAEKYHHEHQVFDEDSDMLKCLHTIVSNARRLYRKLSTAWRNTPAEILG